MKFGDFTTLASNYRHRPAYSPFIRDLFLSLVKEKMNAQSINSLHGADVGAGTGIWTSMLADQGIKMFAVEPNDAMREEGISFTSFCKNNINNNSSLALSWGGVEWLSGSAEATNLPENSFDFVCMASSFHWADYEKAMQEFQRVLKPNGFFIALWNPRNVLDNQMLLDIENKLHSLKPNMQRKSSGNSEFCNGLLDKLRNTSCVDNVAYLEASHFENQAKDIYIKLWESVNDIQVQLGSEKFAEFIEYIDNIIPDNTTIQARYNTRAWIAQIKK